MAELLTSAQNPKFKRLVALREKSRLRRDEGVFVVEGRRELEHCVEAGFEVETVFVCSEIASAPAGYLPSSDASLRSAPPFATLTVPPLTMPRVARSSEGSTPPASSKSQEQPKTFELSKELYAKVAYREGTEGVMAIVKSREWTLADLDVMLSSRGNAGENAVEHNSLTDNELLKNASAKSRGDFQENADNQRVPLHQSQGAQGSRPQGARQQRARQQGAPLIMVLEGVEKPGNLGAVLRSADAAGADAVIVCDPLTDLWNPNLIRASIGAVFTVPTVCCSSQEAIAWLKARGIRILTAQLQDSSAYYDCDMTGPTAIVMGTEATGLTDPWRQAADAHVLIPMLGRLDSLNVSVSAAILLYEAVRQRQ